MKCCRLFTILTGGVVEAGAEVIRYSLNGGSGYSIPAIQLGESGGIRKMFVVPVELTSDQQKEWLEKEKTRIYWASQAATNSSRPKLISADYGSDDRAIIIYKVRYGRFGKVTYAGDRTGLFTPQITEKTEPFMKELFRREKILGKTFTLEEALAWIQKHTHQQTISRDLTKYSFTPTFHDFPGYIVGEGIVAEGADRNKSMAPEILAVVPKDTWTSSHRTGMLHGNTAIHYYLFNGKEVRVATCDQREAQV